VANLEIGKIQRRDGHWAIVDLVGKAGHVRTVPVPDWVKSAIDSWSSTASIGEGRLFRGHPEEWRTLGQRRASEGRLVRG
jgi:hypothetical protein